MDNITTPELVLLIVAIVSTIVHLSLGLFRLLSRPCTDLITFIFPDRFSIIPTLVYLAVGGSGIALATLVGLKMKPKPIPEI